MLKRGTAVLGRNELMLFVLVLATGLVLPRAPIVGWIAVGAIGAVALASAPPILWILGAFLTGALSRVAVAAGAPGFFNFVHYAITITALVIVIMRKPRFSPIAKAVAAGLIGLLAISFASWMVNSGELLRPILTWLVFTEPFQLLLAILLCRPSAAVSGTCWNLMIAIAALQVPIGVYQWAKLAHGNPDVVQGTFIGAGNGAHIAGAVALVGVTICLSEAAAMRGARKKMWLVFLAIALFALPVIGDAKQVIVCFVPAFVMQLLISRGVSLAKIALQLVVLGAAVYVAFITYEPLRLVANTDMVTEGIEGKVAGVTSVLGKMRATPGGWLLGVGPGNSISRVALLTNGGQVKDDSPLRALGLNIAPVTRELLDENASNYLWNSSSAWSTISSWVGLLGDLGPAGLVVYCWVAVKIWRSLRVPSWQTSAARAGIAMAALLACFYSWLEEPGFVLMVALMIGLALTEMEQLEVDGSAQVATI